VEQLFRLISLQDANTRVVLAGATLLGIAAAVIGTLAVLRKRSLVGDAVAHAALPGVCAAYLIVGERHFTAFMLGALAFGVLAAAFVAAVKALTRVKEDAAIAIAIGGFFGVGIVLSRIIQNQPAGNRAGLDSFIFGKAASMVASDAQLILAVAAGVLLAAALLYKEFKILCFDPEFAAGQGWPTFTLDLLLMALVCLCTVVGLPAVGVVLMVALLVIPGVAARFWTDRLHTLLLLAGFFGAASGFLGTVLSATLPAPADSLSRGWPTGPLIVLVAAAIFLLSLLFAPRRGLLADALRRLALARRVADQHLLRDVYEALEPTGDLSRPWDPAHLARPRDLATASAALPPSRAALRRAIRHNLVVPAPGGYALTAEGRAAAARVVRAHRLWELYLIEQADIAPDHVDRDADQIEHVLSPLVIAQLEARLAEQGRLPGPSGPDALPAVPQSPHPITPPLAAAPSSSSPSTAHRLPLWLLAGLGTLLFTAQPARAADTLFNLGAYPVRSEDLWTIATAAVCSVACGVLGCFLVLRRLALLGDAISHAILPGLAVAFLLTGTRDPLAMLAGAMAVGVLTALLSAGLARWGRVPDDAAMGVVFTTLFALGVILISFAARNVDLDPGCVLYGLLEFVPFDTVSLLGLELPRAFAWLSAALLINLALITLFYKELKIVCFDPYLATTMGISAALVHYGLMTAVAATAVASFEAVGSILVIAMLVAPGATAQLLTDRLSRMLLWSAALAALAAVLGYIFAVALNTSIAGMIASVSLGQFILAAIFAPRHGILARRLARPRHRLTPDLPPT
jgi:manganese/zinc/iron transport system permease protein